MARIQDIGKFDGLYTHGLLVESPEFDRFRPYFKYHTEFPDDGPVFDALCELCDEVRSQGEFVLRDLHTGRTQPRFKLGAWGQAVRFRLRD